MAVGSVQPLIVAGTTTIAASTASASGAMVGNGQTCVVYNATTGIAFVAFGTDLTVVATNAGYPVPPGQRAMIGIGQYVVTVAVLLSASSGNVYVSRGEGSAY